MPRSLSAEMLAEIELDHVRPRFFLQIELNDDSTLNFWTGERDVEWNGKTWLSNGLFKSWDQLSESIDGGYEGVTIELAGESSTLISMLLNDIQRYRQIDILFGFANASGGVIDSPVKFSGLIETAVLDDNVTDPVIRIKATSILAILERSVERRFNQQSHAIDYPSDVGFEYVEQMEDFRGGWGKERRKKKDKNKDREHKTAARRNKRRRNH